MFYEESTLERKHSRESSPTSTWTSQGHTLCFSLQVPYIIPSLLTNLPFLSFALHIFSSSDSFLLLCSMYLSSYQVPVILGCLFLIVSIWIRFSLTSFCNYMYLRTQTGRVVLLLLFWDLLDIMETCRKLIHAVQTCRVILLQIKDFLGPLPCWIFFVQSFISIFPYICSKTKYIKICRHKDRRPWFLIFY
jgi:hypothetical protein